MPDLWCALTGARTAERSIASNRPSPSVLANGTELLDAVGVDASVFPPVMENRVVVGELGKELAAKIGARDQWPFVLVASHDTASAVAAASLVPTLLSYPRAPGRWSVSSWLVQSSPATRWLPASQMRPD